MINTQTNNEMEALLLNFKSADKKVTEIESNGGLFLEGYGGAGSSDEYDEALLISQRLYVKLQSLGIDPFSE